MARKIDHRCECIIDALATGRAHPLPCHACGCGVRHCGVCMGIPDGKTDQLCSKCRRERAVTDEQFRLENIARIEAELGDCERDLRAHNLQLARDYPALSADEIRKRSQDAAKIVSRLRTLRASLSKAKGH